MTRGRKPIPTKIRELNGYFKHNTHRKNYLEPEAPDTVPDMPEDLDKIAQQAWLELVDNLKELNILSSCDAAMIELYARTYSRWREAEQMVAKHGAVDSRDGRRSPWDIIRRDNVAACHKMLLEFGLTPSSRSRVHAKKSITQITKIKPRERKPSDN